ncbi:DUF5995 family protein [Streptomyces sp. NPDC001640]
MVVEEAGGTVVVPAMDGVVDRMRALGAGWPPGDGAAVFNRMYLAVTEEIRGRLAVSFFRDTASDYEIAKGSRNASSAVLAACRDMPIRKGPTPAGGASVRTRAAQRLARPADEPVSVSEGVS